MDDKVHVLSNNGTFLFRFNNGEFGSKWCGVWKKDTKYFDYFAFKVNGEFLSSADSQSFDFYDSQYSVTKFMAPGGEVTEETVCADGFIVVTVKPSFDAEIEAEIGVNIRDREEGYSAGKKYDVAEDGKKVVLLVNGDNAKIEEVGKSAFIIRDSGEFIRKESYGVHSPGIYARSRGFSEHFDDASMQNKYVPGVIKASVKAGEEFGVILSAKDMDNETAYKTFKNRLHQVKEYNAILGSVYSRMGPNSVFSEDLLKASIDALYSFANFKDREIYAGFPFFNQFWLRDALIVLPSFLSINNTPFVRSVLERIASMVNLSGLQNFVGGGVYPMDVPALFVINVHEYYKWTGDSEFVKRISGAVRHILKFGKDNIENGLVHDRFEMTWMDTLKREYSVEIQALWAKAFDCAEELLKFDGGDTSWMVSSLSGLLSGIKKYARDGYVSDQLGSDVNSVNQLFLPFCGVSDAGTTKTILENAGKNLLCEYGVTSVAKSDSTFDPRGYHTGAVWPFTTAMLCGIAYANGFSSLGDSCASILAKNLDAQCSSRINEIYQPDGKPEGCPSQAWSIGMIPYVLDRFVLGIDVDVPLNRIRIRKPDASLEAERTLVVNGKAVKLKFSGGGVTSDSTIEENEGLLEITI